MSEQVDQYPRDKNAEPIISVIPSTHGKVKTMPLVIAGGDTKKVSEATGFPSASSSLAKPETTGIWIENDSGNSGNLKVGGDNVSASLGITVVPGGVMTIQADPDEIYIYHAGSGNANVTIMITGKF